jgi:2-oxoglutarate dehydrogenase E2 component (dihydrolipoamide succinyltransferase)
MIEIRMPKLNNNDSAYVLLSWLVPGGRAVNAGDPLAEAETSKAVEELVATGSGLLEPVAVAGDECVPGQLIARLHADASGLRASEALSTASPTAAAPAATISAATISAAATSAAATSAAATSAAATSTATTSTATTSTATGDPMVTAPAAALIAARGISEETVRGWGLTVVRSDDVDRLGTPAATGPAATAIATEPDEGCVTTELSRVQRGVGNAVSRSHREIPAAFTVVEVDVTDAIAAARQLTMAHRTLIGLAELTVAAIAARRTADAGCFSALSSDGRSTELRPGAHVGVTFDLGTGLFAPVVHDADSISLVDLARRLTEHRLAALRGTFREADLQGANITLTLHTEPGVIFAMPIVFPGQACALSLASPRAVAVPVGEDGFRARHLVHVGVAYDHRIVNGSQVIALLRGVKDQLESAAFLAGGG